MTSASSEHLKGYGFDLQYMWHIVYPMNVVSFDMLAVFAVPLVLGHVSLVAAIFLLFYQLHSFLSCFVPSFLPPFYPSSPPFFIYSFGPETGFGGSSNLCNINAVIQ